ncbi:MAG: hypothetical protein AAGG68_09025 [Bacteroidota bacterium]
MNKQLYFALIVTLSIVSCKIGDKTSKERSLEDNKNIYYPSIISAEEFSENSISFTKDESTLFLSRTTGWEYQSGHISTKEKSVYKVLNPIKALDTIYNGAISLSGNKIIFCKKNNGKAEIYLLSKRENEWSQKVNLSQASGIYGGYFYWLTETELFFYTPESNGDIVCGKLQGNTLQITDRLDLLNTVDATEFSPFVQKKKQYLIFTRYLEGDAQQQGFFISFNTNGFSSPEWSEPQKIQSLPYGWNPYVLEKENLFLYSDGEDIIAVPMEKLSVEISALKETMLRGN